MKKRRHEEKIINLKIERVFISQQANLLCDAVGTDMDKVIKWCLVTRGFTVGAGDVVDFLSWKQAQAALDGN